MLHRRVCIMGGGGGTTIYVLSRNKIYPHNHHIINIKLISLYDFLLMQCSSLHTLNPFYKHYTSYFFGYKDVFLFLPIVSNEIKLNPIYCNDGTL